MDEFLAVVGVQAMRYAIRSGIALTSTYALGQCSRLLKSVGDEDILAELTTLRKVLDSKIKIISPAIDLVEFKSGRGNVFLEAAAPLAKSLHQEIVSLGRRIEAAAAVEEQIHVSESRTSAAQERRSHLRAIVDNIKGLLDRIDREIPLLQLAITASGESLSTTMPTGISPSRLLQASTFLSIGDTQFAQDPSRPVQIGPAFTLSLYMLFVGHASTVHQPVSAPEGHDSAELDDPSRFPQSQEQEQSSGYGLGEGDRQPLWQEVLHKARVRLCRASRSQISNGMLDYQGSLEEQTSTSEVFGCHVEYAYHLEIIEDLDDGRVHDIEKTSKPYEDIVHAGIRESIPISQVSKIFYTDTGRILNIGNAEEGGNNPILLLKRDIHARPIGKTEDALGTFFSDANEQDEVHSRTSIDLESIDEQYDVDSQLRRESGDLKSKDSDSHDLEKPQAWSFPAHLDPEWIALEVFEEDQDEEEDGDEDENGSLSSCSSQGYGNHDHDTGRRLRDTRNRSSLDANVIEQIRRLSIRPSTAPSTPQRNSLLPQDLAAETSDVQDFVARSPFGTITTSLSLMEMLIRLTSLQEFQQASHLSIPDHILTFFLEETSTTGLVGETQRRARSEAKRRMGFDPYTDTPTK